MPPDADALALAETLERAYRLALAVEALAGPEGQVISVMATELLGVLDQARASMLRPSTSSRTGW